MNLGLDQDLIGALTAMTATAPRLRIALVRGLQYELDREGLLLYVIEQGARNETATAKSSAR